MKPNRANLLLELSVMIKHGAANIFNGAADAREYKKSIDCRTAYIQLGELLNLRDKLVSGADTLAVAVTMNKINGWTYVDMNDCGAVCEDWAANQLAKTVL